VEEERSQDGREEVEKELSHSTNLSSQQKKAGGLLFLSEISHDDENSEHKQKRRCLLPPPKTSPIDVCTSFWPLT
jgi:hypothetical protein